MSRTFEQLFLSKETDSWVRQFHGSIGTVIGGTTTLTVSPSTGQEQQFITGLSFSSNLSGCSVSLFNGTAFLYHMRLQSADEFKDSFDLLKTSKGTALSVELSNMWGTANLNVIGYTVK